ncbi:hypothetical protein [Nocardia sp. MW-W600-9]
MPERFRPAHMPLRLLVRNDYDTAWNAYGPHFEDFHDLVAYVRESKISGARKRIVQVLISDRPQRGMHRWRITTIWEGFRLPAGMGASYSAETPDHPRDYDQFG